jgi:hypothetical protein
MLPLHRNIHDVQPLPNNFDPTIAPYGTTSLPTAHLGELFRAKRGTHVFKAADGVYLYHIESHYAGAD